LRVIPYVLFDCITLVNDEVLDLCNRKLFLPFNARVRVTHVAQSNQSKWPDSNLVIQVVRCYNRGIVES
jgi:hypothetical protein